VPIIELTTEIRAPIERVFDLARSIDLHVRTASSTNERAVGGVTTGLIGLHEAVTWEARHFGLLQRLTVQINEYDRPHRFCDSIVRGAFQRLAHEHLFEERGEITRMVDKFDFASPVFRGNRPRHRNRSELDLSNGSGRTMGGQTMKNGNAAGLDCSSFNQSSTIGW
jgi:ligand-binding SRPBCC domain-containing protein